MNNDLPKITFLPDATFPDSKDTQRRWFALDYVDGEIQEVSEDDHSAAIEGATIIEVSPPNPINKVRSYKCLCFWDSTGVWELHTNQDLSIALEVCRVALARDAELA